MKNSVSHDLIGGFMWEGGRRGFLGEGADLNKASKELVRRQPCPPALSGCEGPSLGAEGKDSSDVLRKDSLVLPLTVLNHPPPHLLEGKVLTTVLQAKFLLRVCLHTEAGLPHITEVGSGTRFSLRGGSPSWAPTPSLPGNTAKGIHS